MVCICFPLVFLILAGSAAIFIWCGPFVRETMLVSMSSNVSFKSTSQACIKALSEYRVTLHEEDAMKVIREPTCDESFKQYVLNETFTSLRYISAENQDKLLNISEIKDYAKTWIMENKDNEFQAIWVRDGVFSHEYKDHSYIIFGSKVCIDELMAIKTSDTVSTNILEKFTRLEAECFYNLKKTLYSIAVPKITNENYAKYLETVNPERAQDSYFVYILQMRMDEYRETYPGTFLAFKATTVPLYPSAKDGISRRIRFTVMALKDLDNKNLELVLHTKKGVWREPIIYYNVEWWHFIIKHYLYHGNDYGFIRKDKKFIARDRYEVEFIKLSDDYQTLQQQLLNMEKSDLRVFAAQKVLSAAILRIKDETSYYYIDGCIMSPEKLFQCHNYEGNLQLKNFKFNGLTLPTIPFEFDDFINQYSKSESLLSKAFAEAKPEEAKEFLKNLEIPLNMRTLELDVGFNITQKGGMECFKIDNELECMKSIRARTFLKMKPSSREILRSLKSMKEML